MKYSIFFAITLLFNLILSCGSGSASKKSTQNLDSLVIMYPDSLPILIAHGRKMIKEFDFSKAIEDGAKAFHIDSSSIETRLLYADILNNRPTRNFSDVMEAQRHYQIIIRKDPKNLKALVGVATTFSQLHDNEKAFHFINSALKINPRYRDAYVLKGTIYLQIGDKKLAKSSYETAVQQDPKFYEAYLMLGTIYESEKNPICIEYYKTAAKIKSKSPDVLYSLAYAYQNFNKIESAKKLYRKMIQIDTNYHEALFQLGYIKQYNDHELDSAIYYYKSAIETNKKFVEAYHNLGLCYEEKGELTQALNCFADALHYNPNFELSIKEAKNIQKDFDFEKFK
ncbi:MAG: tetratricopeptide repeat protein [Flavobacteriia bacterium]|nr:tetratricopeptide repeat protein [Flavobacteriia bacterium]